VEIADISLYSYDRMGKGRKAVPITSFGGPDMMGTLRFAHPTASAFSLFIYKNGRLIFLFFGTGVQG